MRRIELVSHRKTAITPDTAEALRQLELAAKRVGNIKIHYAGPPPRLDWTSKPGPLGLPPERDMRLAGREVTLRAEFTDREGVDPYDEVAAIWGLAVPLGFIPWARYPEPGPRAGVFHYFGPWQGLYDHMVAAGRGDWAWPSVCCAAQIDVGKWQGGKNLERFVQAQLHRLGIPAGPVDGEIGPVTLAALTALGLKGLSLGEVAEQLLYWETPPPAEADKRTGHVLIPGNDVAVSTVGKITAVRTNNGATLSIEGPGQVVLSIRPKETS